MIVCMGSRAHCFFRSVESVQIRVASGILCVLVYSIRSSSSTFMKKIEIDDELYTFIASHTQHIGESASTILRRLLHLPAVGAAPQSQSASREVKAPSQPMSSIGTRTIFDVVSPADLASQKGVVGRFLHILSQLQRCHAEDFVRVLDIRGRNRLYFSASEAELSATGNSTNPKQIPDSPYWVVTNNNTTKKKSILTDVARELGYSAEDAERIRDLLS